MNSRTFREQDRRAPISSFAAHAESVRERAAAATVDSLADADNARIVKPA
jgi:hypothetical protein